MRRALLLRGVFAPVELDAVDRFAVERFAVERFAAGLRAVDVRLAPADDDFAREVVERFAVERFAVERLAVERFALVLREPLLRDEDAEPPLLDPASGLHLPDMTRWAASATASAMIEPSLVALAMTLVAA